MNCPVCGNPNCVEEADEVDIGIGVQRRVIGWECPECGYMDAAEFKEDQP